MPGRKIQDEEEIIRWFDEGWTYPEMVAEYARKYHIETTPTLFANFRARRGLELRNTRDTVLIPWVVAPEHRFAYPLTILRWEARLRAGKPLSDVAAAKHGSFMARLRDEGLVIEYREDTAEGFHLVARESGDGDVIRRPKRQPTQDAPARP